MKSRRKYVLNSSEQMWNHPQPSASHTACLICFNNQPCHGWNRRKRSDYVQRLHLFHWRSFRLQLIVIFITHILNLGL